MLKTHHHFLSLIDQITSDYLHTELARGTEDISKIAHEELSDIVLRAHRAGFLCGVLSGYLQTASFKRLCQESNQPILMDAAVVIEEWLKKEGEKIAYVSNETGVYHRNAPNLFHEIFYGKNS